MKKSLIFYTMYSCPFCARVVQYLEEHGVELEFRDILETPDYRQELIDLGGKAQVPCLSIDNFPLYESEDIIMWLEDNYIAA
ncbi:glutaredoxin [Candidatus Marinamargulisbacteria bacterium SCGC AG-343-D04]|nr:glutaredoxin [Candidatus Marinamargulisbacteria bacterium SCGC AG-343-D04]